MSKRHFEVTTPRPLGHRQTVNAADADKALERVANRVAEMIAPAIAEAVAAEMKTNASSNGRKIRPEELTSRYALPKGDEFDNLPDGDGWSSYDMNNPPGDESRNPYTPTGEHFDNLPTD